MTEQKNNREGTKVGKTGRPALSSIDKAYLKSVLLYISEFLEDLAKGPAFFTAKHKFEPPEDASGLDPGELLKRSRILAGIAQDTIQTSLALCYEAPNGVQLFAEALLSEFYYLLQAEQKLIEQNPIEIKNIVVEFGAGNGVKTIEVFIKNGAPKYYINIDSSQQHLDETRENLIKSGIMEAEQIISIKADFESPNLPELIEEEIRKIEASTNGERTVLMLGATIGNFFKGQLLQHILPNFRKALGPNPNSIGYLTGDSTQDKSTLRRAYGGRKFGNWQKPGLVHNYKAGGIEGVNIRKIGYRCPIVPARDEGMVVGMYLTSLGEHKLNFDQFISKILPGTVPPPIEDGEVFKQGTVAKWTREAYGNFFRETGIEITKRAAAVLPDHPKQDHGLYEVRSAPAQLAAA